MAIKVGNRRDGTSESCEGTSCALISKTEEQLMHTLVVQQIRLRGMNTDDQVHEATTKRNICFLYFEIIDNRGTVVIFLLLIIKKNVVESKHITKQG
jgi:hypothetical protein